MTIPTLSSHICRAEGKLNFPMQVAVNKELFNDYDLIVSIGQIVPHEVIGMANYTKNIMIGVGGVGFVYIMWTIATTIRRNDPTYMKDHHRRRLNRSMSPLNIVYLTFLTVSQ